MTEAAGRLTFSSLAVHFGGEVPAALAAPLQADWQRQPVNWPAVQTAELSLIRPGEPPAGRLVVASTPNGPLEFRAEGEVFSASGLTLLTSSRGSRVGLGREVSPAALLLAFTEVQRAAGLLPLHASVLSRGGQTVAISGVSGAGKSTAALRLLARGWDLLAEDWAWLHPESGQVVGWDSGLRLRPESLERFAPHLLGHAPTDAHGKRVLSPPRLQGTRALTAVYFLSARPAAPPVSRLEQVRALWSMVGAPLTPAARQATQAGVNRLMSGLPMELAERNELVARLGV